MFVQILEFAELFVSNLNDFATSILDFLGYQFSIGDTDFTLFSLLFTGSIIIIITYGIVKFVADIVL